MAQSGLDKNISSDHKRPSDLDGEALRSNRETLIQRDKEFRDEHVAFEKAEELMDKKSTDTNEEGVPVRNRIRRISEDLLSMMLPSVPKAELKFDGRVDPREPEDLRKRKLEIAEQSERSLNSVKEAILRRSNFQKEKGKIIYDAVVDGVGYAHPRVPRHASRRDRPDLDRILQKDPIEMTPRDLERIQEIMEEPETGHVEAREVFWRAGVRSVDDDEMTRASRARVVDVRWLRSAYADNKIQPGRGPLRLRTQDGQLEDINNTKAGFVETWEIEEFVTRQKHFFMDPSLSQDQATWEVEYGDAILTYTAITTNKLLEKKVFTPREAVMELPFVSYYIKNSKKHPYGFSVPLMLELQQRFANRLRQVVVKQAMNSISPQAFAVLHQALGSGDKGEIERALEEGGPAWLEGNDIQSVKEMIQSFPNPNQGVNRALTQTVKDEERAMDQMGQATPTDALQSARSASGKHAILNAAERPKQYSVINLANAQEEHVERLKKLLQRATKDKERVVPVGQGAEESVVLNEQKDRPVLALDDEGRPMFDESFKSKTNPEGLVYSKRTFIENDVNIPMYAQAKNRGFWPSSIRARLQLGGALAEAGVLKSQKTLREIVLDERTRAQDDRNVDEEQQGTGDQLLQALAQEAGQAAPSTEGSQNPVLAGASQTGQEQTQPGGNAGAPENQVGQNRNSAQEELAEQLTQ